MIKRIMIRGLLIVLLIGFLGGCQTTMSSSSLTYDRAIYGHKYYQGSGMPWAMNHEKENVRAGKGAVRFELRPDDRTWWDGGKHSHRTELRYEESGSGWYGFSIFIPKETKYLSGNPWGKTYVGQWHGGKGVSGEPVISNRIMGNAFAIHVSFQHKPKGIYTWHINDFKKGKWTDFVYEIKFSSRNNGILNGWMDGKQIVSYRGPTKYKAGSPFFKVGIYAVRNVTENYVLYFDEYRRGSSYEEVDPSRSTNTKIDLPESETVSVSRK